MPESFLIAHCKQSSRVYRNETRNETGNEIGNESANKNETGNERKTRQVGMT